MTTKEKILQAAEKVFLQSGYDGARMQAIADEAGMNKALLHYYFENKDNLFEQIFRSKLSEFIPRVGAYFFSSATVVEKMDYLVDAYFDMLEANQGLPLFVLNTMHKNPDFIRFFPTSIIRGIMDYLQAEVDSGTIRPVVPEQFFISVLSMCIFPFLARPVVHFGLGVPEDNFSDFIDQRRSEVKIYIRAILQA